MHAAFTNKTPNAPYRAAYRLPGVFVVERVMDLVARRLNLDTAEVRFSQFHSADALAPLGVTVTRIPITPAGLRALIAAKGPHDI